MRRVEEATNATTNVDRDRRDSGSYTGRRLVVEPGVGVRRDPVPAGTRTVGNGDMLHLRERDFLRAMN